MIIQMEIELDPDVTDSDDSSGLTEEGFGILMDAVAQLGSLLDVRRY